jgi:hypothetical protein
MREAEWSVLEGNWNKLPATTKGQLALLSQILAKTGVHATLIVFESEGKAAAFERAWANPDNIEIILRMAQGGRSPITSVEGRSRYYEDIKQGT